MMLSPLQSIGGHAVLRAGRTDAAGRERRPRRHPDGRPGLHDHGAGARHDRPARSAIPVPRGGAGMLEREPWRARFDGRRRRPARRLPRRRVMVRDGRAVAVRTDGGEVFDGRRAVVADVGAPACSAASWPETCPPACCAGWSGSSGTPARSRWTGRSTGRCPGRPPRHRRRERCTSPSRSTRSGWPARTSPPGPSRRSRSSSSGRWRRPTRAGRRRARSPCGPTPTCPHHTTHDAGDGSISGALGPRRRRADGRPDAGTHRGLRPRLRRPRPRPARAWAPASSRPATRTSWAVGSTAAPRHLHQQLVFRPVPGLGRAETPVAGLYLASASAHPGGGVHGACGSNAARAAVAHDRVRSLIPTRRKEPTP